MIRAVLSATSRGSLAKALLALAALGGVLGAGSGAAGRPATALLRVAEPQGFSGLTSPQLGVVDLYFGGRRIGSADVRHRPDELTFLSPETVLRLLPDIIETEAVVEVLSAPLSPNSNLVCAVTAEVPGCGTLKPEVAGIIFDRDRFRVDLFINPRFLGVRPATERTYLQSPDDNLSFLASFDAVVSGSDRSQAFYNVQNHLLVGWGEARLRADLALASGFGLQSERISVELDRPGWRYSAGSFWIPGSAGLSRRKIVGLGIESQVDTRLDKEVARGTPLVVFLSQRSRVDILLDQRVVASRIYDAGNQTLDTSGLPDGTYEILLRIEELGGGRREETRLFTRNPRIPSTGQAVLFAFAGALVNDRTRGFLDVTSHPLVQVGGARRFSSSVALDATLMATDRAAVGELGGYLITKPGILRVALIAHSEGHYGGLVQLSSNGTSPFNFHFDLRRMVVDAEYAQSGNFDIKSPSDLALGRRSHTQASGTISYSLPNAQISIAASFRNEDGIGRTYAIGPAVRWNVLRRGDWRLFLNGDAAVTDQGTSGYVGFNLQFHSGSLALGARGGTRMSTADGDQTRSSFVGAIDGAIQREAFGGTLDLGVGYEHEIDRDVLSGAANLRTQTGSMNVDVLRTFGAQASQMQYSLGLHTTLLGGGNSLALEGRQGSESMVVVKVDGAQPQDRFEVLINDARVASVAGDGGQVVVPVPAYREYDVRIRPESGGLVQYDSSVRRVSVYPGSVAALQWKARSIMPVFGRIQLPEAGKFTGATILTEGGPVEIEESGFFQIEAASGGQVDVQFADGRSCELILPVITSGARYLSAGDVMCDPGVRLGSVHLSKAPQ